MCLTFISEARNILQKWEGFLVDGQTLLSPILSYRDVLDIKSSVPFERSTLVGSTPLKNFIHRKVPYV